MIKTVELSVSHMKCGNPCSQLSANKRIEYRVLANTILPVSANTDKGASIRLSGYLCIGARSNNKYGIVGISSLKTCVSLINTKTRSIPSETDEL